MKAGVPCQQSALHTQEWTRSMESRYTPRPLPPAGQNPPCTNLFWAHSLGGADLLPHVINPS